VSGTRKEYRVGTHRAITPEETVAHAERFTRALGITRVADVTRLDTIGLPVVVVHRPNARSLSVSQGKGFSLAAAKASGLMEAIELYHAEHITLPVRFASLDDLRSNYDLVDVTALPRLSVGHFHGDLRLLWIEGVNLLNDAPLWLPYELVHTDFTLPFPPGSGCFVNSSNGLASGNRLVEALVHAICEVVERDATTLWHMAGASGEAERRFDPGSIDDPLCAEVLGRFEAADVAVGIWETTSDVGVPAFFCTILDREPRSWRQLYPSSGAGCHPNCSIALLRALTEAAQSRLTLISGARDDQPRAEYRTWQDVDAVDRLRREIEDAPRLRRFQDVPTFEADLFEDDLAWLLDRLHRTGLRTVVAVDLTKPDIGIPVFRVVVPGLEPPHEVPGYVPGARARALTRMV
jgi:ribosomal protein S12 methylthiotransferase accessory factor